MPSAAKLSSQSLEVEPGGQASVDVTVVNTGQTVDQYAIEIVGVPSQWSAVEPPTVSLFPGKEERARVTFRPPRSSDTGLGPLPFGIRVRPRDDPRGSVVEEGTLQVGRFAENHAELAPRASHGRIRARHDLAFDNRGNGLVAARLTGTDPEKALKFAFHPPYFKAEPGTASFVKVRVEPVKRFLRGAPKTRPFKITISPEDDEPVLLDGTMVQEALLPGWLLPALAALAALVVAAALLWIFLLNPAVKSTAQDAVAGPLSQQGQNLGALQKQVGQNAAAIGDLQHAAGSNNGSGVTPTGAAAPAIPFDFRLSPGSGTMASYAPQSGWSASVTDIFFENPDGNSGPTGDVTLERVLANNNGTQVLLREGLANFRDLDEHFVTPIAVGSGEKLEYTCDTSCGNSSVYITGTTKPSP